MGRSETTVTQKGQVTIPIEIRSRLGLKPHDRVEFVLEGDSARLRPARSAIARHFGAVDASHVSIDERSERAAFEQGVADEVSTAGL